MKIEGQRAVVATAVISLTDEQVRNIVGDWLRQNCESFRGFDVDHMEFSGLSDQDGNPLPGLVVTAEKEVERSDPQVAPKIRRS